MHIPFRSLIVLSYDTVVAAIAVLAAFIVRYDTQIFEHTTNIFAYSSIYAITCFIVFASFRLHRTMWRYSAAKDIMWLIEAVIATSIVAIITMFFFDRLANFPRTAIIMLPLFHIAFAATPRFAIRIWREQKYKFQNKGHNCKNALIVGMNDGTDIFLREVNSQNKKNFKIFGIIDDDKNSNQRTIHGVSVLGSSKHLDKIIKRLNKRGANIQMLILTENHHANVENILTTAQNNNLVIKRIPTLADLQDGVKATSLRKIDIEDLLGRQSINLDMSAIEKLVKNKRVFITGAGGSIGSELCRQIIKRHPKQLIISDNNEHNLYQIDMELKNLKTGIKQNAVLLDVKDEKTVNETLANFKSDIIFHAAAYKHVPMVENNPIAGIENNLFGTITIADAANNNNVPKLVIISTDKAVNPTNVMGATKRAAEIYCGQQIGTTKIITVRFGNVLGSTGSVVPLFTRQIRNGGPITVTHKDATRYFMTIPEAVQLTLQAATLGEGGEVFMLDMGEPVKIWDMATEMVKLSGLIPHEDIEIVEVGLRPGEKMFEEMWYDGENMSKTKMEKIFLVSPVKITKKELNSQLNSIKKACTNGDNFAAVEKLQNLVPEYTPAANSIFIKKG